MALPEIPATTQIVSLQITFDPTRLAPPCHWDWNEMLSMHGVESITIVNSSKCDDEDIEPLSFTAADLSSLLFPDTLYPPLSPDPREMPLFRIRVVPYMLGLQVANLDPSQEFFHCFFYPNRRPSPQVEIWSAVAWKVSLTRRLQRAAIARELDPSRDLNNRIENLKQNLIHFLAAQAHVSHKQAKEMADGFIYFYSQFSSLLQVLNPPQDLQDELLSLQECLSQVVPAAAT